MEFHNTTNWETETNNTTYGHLSSTNICTRRDSSDAEIVLILPGEALQMTSLTEQT